MTTPVIDLRGGVVTYDARTALDRVDLRVGRGEVVAVLGANGSGKSTLVRAVVGLVPLRAGELQLFGVPAAQFRERTRLGYVPQRAGATTGVPATVREVVSTGRLARLGHRRMRAVDRLAVEHALETVDLAGRADDGVAELSGGQQQRVLIARALAGEPDLLVLDEPLAGVDLEHQQALAVALRRLAEAGVTVLLVLHELGAMQPLIGRAVTLADGRVLHDGPPPEADHVHLHDPEHAHPPHGEQPAETMWGLS